MTGGGVPEDLEPLPLPPATSATRLGGSGAGVVAGDGPSSLSRAMRLLVLAFDGARAGGGCDGGPGATDCVGVSDCGGVPYKSCTDPADGRCWCREAMAGR